MIGCFFASAVYSLPFFLMGAWPVVGFLGLDVLALYLAFKINYRAARGFEELSVTYLELLFARVSAVGLRREWRFNPTWVRLERVEDEDYGMRRLWLLSRDRRWEIGGFLGPEQRAAVANRLGSALAEARRGLRRN